MWVLIITLFFILVLTLFFVLPLRLIVDSERQLYSLEMICYFKFQLVPDSGLFLIKGRVLFYPFTIRANSFFKKEWNLEKQVIKNIKTRDKVSLSQGINLGKGLYDSVKIHHLQAGFDTGNHPVNAQLIPVLSILNRQNISIQVNFLNSNWVDAMIYIRVYKILWVLFKNLRLKK